MSIVTSDMKNMVAHVTRIRLIALGIDLHIEPQSASGIADLVA